MTWINKQVKMKMYVINSKLINTKKARKMKLSLKKLVRNNKNNTVNSIVSKLLLLGIWNKQKNYLPH